MDCEHAVALISAEIDREIQPIDRDQLAVHLHECSTCSATAEAFRLQHTDLRRAFEKWREGATLAGERVIAVLPETTHLAPTPELRRLRRRLGWALTAAAVVAAVVLGWQAREQSKRPRIQSDHLAGPTVASGMDVLTAHRRPPAAETKPLQIGATLRTAAGETRRVRVPDGSIVYINQNSTVTLEANRQLRLAAGEVFVEVTPQSEPQPFLVKTPEKQITALGTKFDVRADAGRTGVIVTQGKVAVSGVDRSVPAGQQLDGDSVAPAPRASHVLDWTKDLMIAADSPLVPGSQYGGGALVAVDPYGEQAKLSLRKYHIDVYIEDGFARTTIDQTYFNAAPWRLEGTFHFPLPPDASLSRLAMYVDGKLMEGGMAERDYARQVYETIKYTQKDPALLEWVDGSTFKMRVFPLEARQEKRIILSYTQRLPALYGRTTYRFPAGHSLDVVRDWSFHARVIGERRGVSPPVKDHTLHASSPSHPELKIGTERNDLLLDDAARNVAVNRDVVVELSERRGLSPPEDRPKDPPGQARRLASGERLALEDARFSSAEQDGYRYLMLRYRPDLPSQPVRQRRDWVFLFESSGDRDPLLARTQIDIIRALLENAEHDDTFAILTAGTRVRTASAKPQAATAENIEKGIEFLEHSHLIGALDLGKAFTEAEPFLKGAANPYLVHVGSGIAAMGERRDDALIQRLPAGVRYVGVGVGKRWNRSFMKLAAERTGGYFTQINPDEPISWRGFDLAATLNTPRLLDIKVTDDAGNATFLTYANSIAQGEEICAMTRQRAAGFIPAVPQSLTLTGTLDGQPYRRTVPVQNIAQHAGYLPRTWAKLEIDRLLAEFGRVPQEKQQKAKDEIIALSKSMYVMTPFTSLLVLENEQMYEQFKVDRGRKDHWAMYPCPDKIPIVYEPDADQPADPRAPQLAGQKPHRNQVMQSVMVRVSPQWIRRGRENPDDKPMLTALQVYGGGVDIDDSSGRLLSGRLPRERSFKMSLLDLGDASISSDEPPVQFPPAAVWRELTRLGKAPYESTGVGRLGGGLRAHPVADLVIPIGSGDGEGRVTGKEPGFVSGGEMWSSGGTPDVLDQLAEPATILAELRAIRQLSESLARPVTLERGIQKDTPLKDALEFLSDRYGLTIIIDTRAFEAIGVQHVEELSVSLPKVEGVSLGTVLRLILSQVKGGVYSGTYLARRDYVEVTTTQQRGAEKKFENEWERIWFVDQPSHLTPERVHGGIDGANGPFDGFFAGGFRSRLSHNKSRSLPVADFKLALEEIPGSEGMFRLESETELGQRLRQERRVPIMPVLDDGRVIEQAADLLPEPMRPGQYSRPSFSNDARLFSDLVAYARGMNTSRADIQAVLEAEAAPELRAVPGRIDPAARRLIERARSAGWQALTIPKAFTLFFDGRERYAYERVLPLGLRERVVCDGKTLLHLYPELGIGARRAVSRFHRAELLRVVPWLLPPAEDLARGADVRFIDEHTVAIVPAGVENQQSEPVNKQSEPGGLSPRYVALHLIFAEDGRLAERRLVAMPSKKVIARETYRGGAVRVVDAKDKELASYKLPIAKAAAPSLRPDTSQLVLLPMPLRSREQVYEQFALDPKKSLDDEENGCFEDLTPDEAMQLFAANWAIGRLDDAGLVFKRCFYDRGVRLLGFYTFLAAGRAYREPEFLEVVKGQPNRGDKPPGSQLARYLSLQSYDVYTAMQQRWDLNWGEGVGSADSFLGRLARFRDLYLRWQSRTNDLSSLVGKQARQERALRFIRENRSNIFGLAALLALDDLAGDRRFRRDIGAAWKLFEETPGFGYIARYEQARSLLHRGKREEAGTLLRELYAKAAKDGALPPIDSDFRQALRGDGKQSNLWDELIRETAAKLVKEKRRPAVAVLAWQCWRLDDQPLAANLVSVALEGIGGDAERLLTNLACIEFLAQTNQLVQAGSLLQPLLENPKFAGWSYLWRLGSRIAEQRQLTARSIECLERSLEIEYRQLPDVINLETVRKEYGTLLDHYQSLAEAAVAMKIEPPRDLAARTVRAADRWRALDRDSATPCQSAAKILRTLSAEDLAWDYLTTPIGQRPNESDPWVSLAQTLSKEGNLDLADRAYTAAFDAEPTNAQILWDRAQLLRQAGKHGDAKELVARLAAGPWDARFQSLQSQARWQLDGR